jgi:TorA maturation chaperone TorD
VNSSGTGIDIALARSIFYATVARAFARPSEPVLRRLASPDTCRALEAAAALLDAGARRPVLAPAADRFGIVVAAAPVDVDGAGDRYTTLFGHTARGPVCPFATEYGGDGLFSQPRDLANLAGFYLAFGLRPAPDNGERADHIACQCEFMDFLCRKEAVLLAAGETEEEGRALTAAATRQAARRFVREHLGCFGRTFGLLLAREDDGGFYGTLGSLLVAFLDREHERLGLPPASPALTLRPFSPDDATACGGSGSSPLIQVQRREASP